MLEVVFSDSEKGSMIAVQAELLLKIRILHIHMGKF